jgi:hypothetical protein
MRDLATLSELRLKVIVRWKPRSIDLAGNWQYASHPTLRWVRWQGHYQELGPPIGEEWRMMIQAIVWNPFIPHLNVVDMINARHQGHLIPNHYYDVQYDWQREIQSLSDRGLLVERTSSNDKSKSDNCSSNDKLDRPGKYRQLDGYTVRYHPCTYCGRIIVPVSANWSTTLSRIRTGSGSTRHHTRSARSSSSRIRAD